MQPSIRPLISLPINLSSSIRLQLRSDLISLINSRLHDLLLLLIERLHEVLVQMRLLLLQLEQGRLELAVGLDFVEGRLEQRFFFELVVVVVVIAAEGAEFGGLGGRGLVEVR